MVPYKTGARRMRQFLASFIEFYSYLISPLLGGNCRFTPSCSAYAREAILTHGICKGSMLTITRIMSCHPWSGRCGHDPIPQSVAWGNIIGYKRPNSKPERDKALSS